MRQLTILSPGAPDQHLRIDRPCTMGGAEGPLSPPALGDAVLDVVPHASGLVVRCTRSMLIANREVAPGTPRLIRGGERVRVGGATFVASAAPLPEGTRELAGALLSGFDPTPPVGPTLLVVEGTTAGQRFAIGDGVVVGRGGSADVALEDPLVSRLHLRLERREGAYFAIELASKNGLLVNGARPRWRRTRLAHGDELRIGETVLILETIAAAGSEHPDTESPRIVDAAARRASVRPSREEDGHVGHRRSPHPALVTIASASAALLAAALLLARAAG